MDKAIEFLQNNPNYVTALIITFVALIVCCVLGFFINKYNLLRFMDKWFPKKEQAPDVTKEDQPLPPAEDVSDTDEQTYSEDNQADAEVIEDAPISEASTDFIDEPQPEEVKKNTRFSEMIKQSLENSAADQYEMDKKLSSQPAPAPVKKEVLPEPEPVEEPVYEGKWRVIPIGSTYVAHLYTDDDRLLLKSQSYKVAGEAKRAIATLKKNIDGNNFSIAVNKKGQFYFKLFTPSGRLVCSGEPCATNNECKQMIDEVKRIAFTAEYFRG